MIIELNYTIAIAAITTVFGFYKAVCWILDRYNIGQKRKESRLLKSANKNMMRQILRNAHRDYTAAGSIDNDELEHIQQVYEVYHELGGNGTAKRWLQEMQNLPRGGR